jgi:TetR/AcrR family transcriptional regulator, cholesterol catabolism regulator
MNTNAKSITTETTESSSRTALMEAAVALMAEKGYHGTSMSDLEAVSGLGRSSIYHYVRGKEALLAEICSESTRRQAQIARTIVEKPGPARDALYCLIKSLVTEIIRNRQRALVSLREMAFLTGEYRKGVLKLRAEYEEHWRTVLQRAAAEGLIYEFSEFDMNAILGMVNYSAIWIHRVPGEKVNTMAERFTTIALQGITSDRTKS